MRSPPDDLDTQGGLICRHSISAAADLSFDAIAYRSGEIPGLNRWDFDDVRFGTDWSSMMTMPEPATMLIWSLLAGLEVGLGRGRGR